MKIPIRFLLLLLIFGTLTNIQAQPYRAAYWSKYLATTQVFPYAGVVTSPYLMSAQHNYSGLIPYDDLLSTSWKNPNTSTTLNIASAPYLSYIVKTNNIIRFDRFVINCIGIIGGSKLQLRWSLDNYGASLGEFTPNGTTGTLTSVNLTAANAAPAGTIEFRIYYYSASGMALVFFAENIVPGSSDGTPNTYGHVGQGISIWYTSPNPILPCTGTPIGGTSNVSPSTGNIFTYGNATLSLTDYTADATGISIQWQASPASGGPFSDIAGATSPTFNTGVIVQHGTSYYRAKVSCTGSGLYSYSNEKAVTATFMPAPGNALKPDGINDFIDFGNSPIVFPANIKAMECWVRFGTFGDQEIISRSTTSYGIELMINGGNLSFNCMKDANNRSYINYASANLQAGIWYHLAASWSGTKETMQLYVNGALVGSRVDIGNINSGIADNPAVNLRVGMWNGATARYFNGTIDEIRIWNTSRTQTQVQANMYNIVSGSSAGLTAYYNFDEGTVGATNPGITTAYDATSNGINGTLTNFALSGITSNWVESYGMVVPFTTAATKIDSTGFTANWTAPTVGIVQRYFLDVSTRSDFSSFAPGYNSLDIGAVTTYTVSNVAPVTTYYYRVRAQRSPLNGQGAHSNVSNATTTSLAPPGNALRFTSTKRAVTIAPNPALDFATGTIECWVKRDVLSAADQLLAGSMSSSASRYAVYANESSVNLWNGSTSSRVTLPTKFVAGIWYHIAVVIRSGASDVYVNGIYINATSNGMGSVTGLPFTIGASSAAAISEVLIGTIDEIRIWNIERTAAEIQSGQNDIVSASSPGLVAYYKFDQGVPSGNNTGFTTAFDVTANHLDGIINGFDLTGNLSNWVESYAMVVPALTAPSFVNSTSFIAKWTSPARGVVNSYLLDVSTTPDFNSLVTGYESKNVGNVTSATISGLLANTNYFYRISANKTGMPVQGAYSASGTITTCGGTLVPSISMIANPAGTIISGTNVQFTAVPVNGGTTPVYTWSIGHHYNVQSGTSNVFTTSSLINRDTVEVSLISNAACITSSYNAYASLTVRVVGPDFTWIGGNGNWNTPSNWNVNAVPSGCAAKVTIPSGTPSLTGTVNIGTLNLGSGAGVNLTGTLSICADLTSTAGIAANIGGTGKLILNGFASQVITGNFAISNLELNNSAGASIYPGSQVILTGTFTPTLGAMITNNGLTLASNSSGTASIAKGTGTYIIGNITVERYFPAKHAIRFVTAPLSNTGTIFANWQNNGNVVAGTGVEIWRPSGGAGFATGGSAASIHRYNEMSGDWTDLDNTDATNLSDNTLGTPDTIADNKSFSLLVTGPFGSGNINVSSIATVTTLKTTGQIQTGTQALTFNGLPANRFVLVGNPYASPVDFTTIGKNNIKNGFWAWDPQRSGTTLGGYVSVSWDDVTGTYDIDYPSSQTAQTKIIQNGQAILVQAQTGGATTSVTFNENDKAPANLGTNGVFRVYEATQQLRIVLNRSTANADFPIDAVLAKFGATYSSFTDDDVMKLTNYDENLSLQRGGTKLSIERKPLVILHDTLYLHLDALKANSDYSFEFKPELFENPLISAYLLDSYLGTKVPISLTTAKTLQFSTDATAVSVSSSRFTLVFSPTSALPLKLIDIKSYQNSQGVRMDWHVRSEVGVKSYLVERSANGIDFFILTTVMARNLNIDETYTYTDNNPLQGNNFYRIRIVENDEVPRYSAIVKVQVKNKGRSFIIYPNPVKSRQVNLQLTNSIKGTYSLSLYNQFGQLITNSTFIHEGYSARLFTLPANLSAGNYQVVVRNSVHKEIIFSQSLTIQ